MADNRIPIQEKMFALIDQWKQSGLPKKKFCIEHQVANATFHYWCKKYKLQDTDSLPSFIPVHVKENHSSVLPLAELSLPDGKKLTFFNSLDASILKSLLF